jgi:hypothetical protein
MSVFSQSLGREVEDRLFTELHETGIACLPDVIDPSFLALCRTKIDRLLQERGEHYFSLIQPWKGSDPEPFNEISTDQSFLRLMSRLAARGHSEQAVADFELYSLLRVIAGPESATRAFQFHYDATVLTVLMPLLIPHGPPHKAGDLVALPNSRPFRHSTVLNVVEKALVQNRIANALRKRRYISGLHNIVKLVPGSLYFFWGYRTLHGNLPAEANQRRATLLFHYGDPHPNSTLTKTILKLKWLRERARGNTPDAG